MTFRKFQKAYIVSKQVSRMNEDRGMKKLILTTDMTGRNILS